jgi:hypothetical protein
MKNNLEEIKMYFCKFDCPFKNNRKLHIMFENLQASIENSLESIDIDINSDDLCVVSNILSEEFDYFEEEFSKNVCKEDICPLNKFIEELKRTNVI